MSSCIDHLNHCGGSCPECGLEVDDYGNTEAQFEHCTFPHCGCDGARLCMAGDANLDAQTGNVEGMWSGKTRRQRQAVVNLTLAARLLSPSPTPSGSEASDE